MAGIKQKPQKLQQQEHLMDCGKNKEPWVCGRLSEMEHWGEAPLSDQMDIQYHLTAYVYILCKFVFPILHQKAPHFAQHVRLS
jgi:hypothetical protein